MNKYVVFIFAFIVFNATSSVVDNVYARGGDKGFCLSHPELQSDENSVCYTGAVPRMP